MVVRFSVSPARFASIRAVFTPPIRLMTRTSGLSKNTSAISPAAPGAWVTTLMTPLGNPASSATCASIRPAEIGEYSDGFTTTVLPAASGEITARQERMLAPFQGVKLATTPSGRRTPIEWDPGTLVSRTSPLGRYIHPAACSRVAATRSCWNLAYGIVQPVSCVRARATSSPRRRTISTALKNSLARSAGVVCDQAGKALAAASTANLASSRRQSATRAYSERSYVWYTSKSRLPSVDRHSPPAKYLYSLTPLTLATPLVSDIVFSFVGLIWHLHFERSAIASRRGRVAPQTRCDAREEPERRLAQDSASVRVAQHFSSSQLCA